MLRSLIAIICAVFIGLITAKFIEGMGLAASDAGDNSGTYSIWLLVSWTIAAFTASLVALLIAKRWAPIGALGASTMTLAAIVATLEGGLGITQVFGAFATTGLAGFGAIKLLNASWSPPVPTHQESYFDD